jgi:hypothetical protein
MSGGMKANGRTYKTQGVNDRSIRLAERQKHRDLDPQGLLTPEVVREFIASAMCPYCPAGPFKMLSGHTNRAHGIDRHELRVAAHLSEAEPISSPEVRRAAQERASRYGFGTDSGDASAAAKKARQKGQGAPTAAGLDRRRKNISRVTSQMTAEDWKSAREKAWQTMIGNGTAAGKVAHLHASKGDRSSQEIAQIIDLVRQSGLSARDVQARFGYSKTRAYQIVRAATGVASG